MTCILYMSLCKQSDSKDTVRTIQVREGRFIERDIQRGAETLDGSSLDGSSVQVVNLPDG
jgi:hypothetical protein